MHDNRPEAAYGRADRDIDPSSDAGMAFLERGGEMGRSIGGLDWAATSPGAPQAWPQSLDTVVGILTNAAQSSEPGAIVELAGAREVDQIRIDVKDTGIGISPALLPRVFEMFSQTHGSRDRTESGLGMASHS